MINNKHLISSKLYNFYGRFNKLTSDLKYELIFINPAPASSYFVLNHNYIATLIIRIINNFYMYYCKSDM